MSKFKSTRLFSALTRVFGLRTQQEFEAKTEALVRTHEDKLRELQQRNEALEEFVSFAAHDLRAPLRAIQNAASWLEEDLDEECLRGDTKEHLRLLKGRAMRMQTLLNALLEYARAGRAAYPSGHISTRAMVDEIVFLLGDHAPEQVVVQGELPEMFGARAPLQQVLFNLIGNAIKHGGNDPTLRVVVTAREENAFQVFEVNDNGPGVAPEFFERIFDAFWTLRSRDEVDGAGLGLALVKKLVDEHGGQITVQSNVSQGTTFRVSWPKSSLQTHQLRKGPLAE